MLEAKGAAGVHRHHLVNAVAEDETAVHHADLGVAQIAEFAVEIAGQRGQVRFAHCLIVAALFSQHGRQLGVPYCRVE
jgi:hypothetical protein